MPRAMVQWVLPKPPIWCVRFWTMSKNAEHGAAALRDFEEKFDHVRPKNLRVPVEAIKDALTTLDPKCAPPSRNRCAAPAPWPPTRCRRTSTPTSPKAPAWPNAGFRFSVGLYARRQGRLRAPSS